MVTRFASVVGLHDEHRDEYLRLHASVWPEVEARILQSNIRNYTIFLRDDLLFGYFEYFGDDYAADMAAIASHPETQRWWALTDPCQRRLASDSAEQWAPLQEVWHLD